MDLFNGLRPHFLSTVPPTAMTDGMKAAAVPSDISWITEGRKPGQLTAGLKVEATVGRIRDIGPSREIC